MPPTTRSRKRKSEEGFPTDAEADISIVTETKKQKKLPVRAKDADGQEPKAASAKGVLKVFGEDDDNAVPEPAPVKPAAPVADEEEEDSDDEAPEAVSTSKAASDVKKSSQAAEKAAKEQAAAQKRKRQERDALFKQQAEERRKLEEAAAPVADASEDSGSALAVAKVESNSRGRRRTDKVSIPNLLPAEFLTDSSSEDEEEDDLPEEATRPKKRRVTTIERGLARENRGPKDERLGNTVYRVTKKVDERMAPKARKHARSSKDLLLKRNRSAAGARSGFFVKK